MRILTDPLPDSVTVAGVRCPINPDYRIMMRLSMLSEAEKASESDFLRILLEFYRGNPPSDIEKAVESLCWFASCGKRDSSNKRVTPDLKNEQNQ